MQKNVIMSVDHLSKDFVIRGKKIGEKSKLLHALSDVSFDIYEGETLGIIGESGCGKSTLGRCLVKLHKPSAGTITYNGKDLRARGSPQGDPDDLSGSVFLSGPEKNSFLLY